MFKLLGILFAIFMVGATADPLVSFTFEDGLIPQNAITYGNTDIVTGVAKGGIHLPCYDGAFCLRIAPGQGPRNHDAGIEFSISDIQVGDVISFWYIIVPEVNNDFAGFSLSGLGFFDWREIPPSETWKSFSYTVPDLGGGGPSLMAVVPSSSSDWHINLWAENVIGDLSRTSLWADQVDITRIPEPGAPLLLGMALIALGLFRKQQ